MSDELVEKFANRAFQSKSARFGAHHRYKFYHLASIWTLNLSSAVLIPVSLMDRFNLISKSYLDYLGFWELICSVLILVMSLIITVSQFKELSDYFLKSGNEINRIYNKLKYLKGTNFDQKVFDGLQNEYEDLMKTSINHDDVDFYKALFKNKETFKKHIEKMHKLEYGWFWLKCHFIYNFLPFALVVIFILMLLIPTCFAVLSFSGLQSSPDEVSIMNKNKNNPIQSIEKVQEPSSSKLDTQSTSQ